jgi:elongation factor Ts
MLDCRKALVEAGGDFEKAKTVLIERGAAHAEKKADRSANEGLVASYIHAGGKIGVLVEVNSETDFVARNPKFAELARDIAMHIAALSPEYLNRESIPANVVDEARNAFRANVPAGKPPEVVEKIVEGKLNKWFEERVLLDQAFVKDDAISITDLINTAIGTLGEKISVRRFAKFALGEN